jgi:hypothetical protein
VSELGESKTSGAVKQPLIASIPVDVLSEIAQRLATEVGFGAGPGCIAVNLQTLDPPVSLDVAMSWLEDHRSVFRRGHAQLDDGTRLFFDPNGFLRVASKETP